jgi:hypothetical protein
VGGSPAAVVLEGQIWAFGPGLGSMGYDQDARLRYVTAAKCLSCAFFRSFWLVSWAWVA